MKEECIEKCRVHGFSLAGFQYKDDCFCGDESLEDLIEFKVPEDKCDFKYGEKVETEPKVETLTLFVYQTGSLPNQLSPVKMTSNGTEI